jgi:hypothetical protein
VLNKLDTKEGDLFDNRYVTMGYVSRDIWGDDDDGPLAKAFASAAVSGKNPGLVTLWETEEGTAKAKSLMALQESEKAKAEDAWKGIEAVEKALGAAKKQLARVTVLEDAEGVAIWKSKVAYLEDLKRRMSNSQTYPKWSGWMREYITKPTKAGVQSVEYVKVGDFKNVDIGKNAEGLIKLHAACDNKIAYVALRQGGASGHAVGLHRLNEEGKTVFFDPNMGSVTLRKVVFDKWLEFYWENSKYTFQTLQAKVFQRVEMAAPAKPADGQHLAKAFQQRGDTRQNRRAGQWRQ